MKKKLDFPEPVCEECGGLVYALVECPHPAHPLHALCESHYKVRLLEDLVRGMKVRRLF
jgi:hypothetical protein